MKISSWLNPPIQFLLPYLDYGNKNKNLNTPPFFSSSLRHCAFRRMISLVDNLLL